MYSISFMEETVIRICRSILPMLIALCLAASAIAAPATLYRDRYGVPSVAAGSLPDAFYALGYATAQDSAERMALNYKQARGRLAEVEGRSQLLTDGFIRSLGMEEMAEKEVGQLSEEQSTLIRSYCAGAAKALAEQKGRLPDWIEPFTPVDVLALAQLVNAAFPLEDLAHQLLPSVGSNQFAVAAKRSANGHAILSADPHLPWEGILGWYEFALYTPDIQFHGVTLPGLPFGVMGHTSKVAWCMTNNDPKLFDIFTVKTNPANASQYSYHGEWRDFESVRHELKYRDGAELKSQMQTTRRTAWGPMLPFRSQAVRFTMLGSWTLLDEILQMAKAQDVVQFREALAPHGISMWNFVFADTQGNIGYQYNARVPHRDESFDWFKPVPGNDPKTALGDFWSNDDLPHVLNPKSGLLINANSGAWRTPQGDEIAASGWPAYVTNDDLTTRYERLAELLSKDNSISIGKAKRYATDTQVPYALAAVRALKQAVQRAKEQAAPLKDSLHVLTSWNGRADIGSKGCGLYVVWYRAGKSIPGLARKASRGEAWSAEEAAAAVDALGKAADEMKARHGKLDIPWGRMHTSQRGTVTVPVSGFGYMAPGDSTASVVPNSGVYQNGNVACTFGSSFRMIVDLDPKGVRSWTILPFGCSADPKNPHYADQMALFGRGEYKDTLFGLERIKRAAVSHVTLESE